MDSTLDCNGAMAQTSALSPWLSAYNARDDLLEFKDNALGLFALGLRFNLEDLETVAAEAITDGSDDKKCDIVYVDPDEDYAVVMQCFISQKPKASAPSNKADDLNTALTWLISRSIKDLPVRLASPARELREGISSGRIKTLHVWYTHNLPASTNVSDEMKTVEHTASTLMKTNFPEKEIKVSALEVGSEQLGEWYNDTQSPILVPDEFSIDVEGGYEIAGPAWNAFVTAMPLQFLRSAYKKHGVKLFSANVRDYLGSISSEANINNGIKGTAEKAPENFWAFNNGLTILVNSYDAPKRLINGRLRFRYVGMSIVNGAQTTGAISSLVKAPPQEATAPVRFIKTDDQDIVYDVIRFNNSQNKITAADFRSTDSVQRRLRDDMQKVPSAEYEGGRRGGLSDAIRRRPNLLSSYTVGQALAAIHGDAIVAYNQKSEIWANDRIYSRYFNEQTTAQHIVFAYALLKAVEAKKLQLVQRSRQNEEALTDSERTQLTFLRKRGSTHLFVAALSSCLEPMLGQKVHNLFRLSFSGKNSPVKAIQLWSDIVDALAPLSIHLEEALTDGLKSQERVKTAIQKFKSLVEVTAGANAILYKKFSANVIVK